MDEKTQTRLKTRYLRKAISEYEYSPASEYEKSRMSALAARDGTVDFDYKNAESDVEISMDGAWVKARVWIPKGWLFAKATSGKRRKSTGSVE
jgi:hypothetical protein